MPPCLWESADVVIHLYLISWISVKAPKVKNKVLLSSLICLLVVEQWSCHVMSQVSVGRKNYIPLQIVSPVILLHTDTFTKLGLAHT